MATIAVPGATLQVQPAIGREEKFFFIAAIVMALVLVAGFGGNLLMGRSSFATSPLRTHVHAFLFFGWTALYVAQNTLVATGSLALHRKLGWVATVWVPAMVIVGIYLTAANIRSGKVPPFFEPAGFLILNSLHVLCFSGLVAAAIRMRRSTQWHRRLMFCGMATLLAPGFGRLLPMPLLIPWAGWAVVAGGLLFVVAGVIRDLCKDGRVHPAWWWGMGAILLTQLLVDPIAHSGLGLGLYEAVTSGSTAALPPYGFQIPPPGA
jgi:hypothetical protein